MFVHREMGKIVVDMTYKCYIFPDSCNHTIYIGNP